MKDFVALYLALDATNSTREKQELLTAYLSGAPAADAAWCVALIAGQRVKGGTSSAKLTELALRRTGLPGWMLAECRTAVGELSETLALVVPGDAGAGDPLPLAETMGRYVLPLPKLDDDGKEAVITEAWDRFGRDERFVFHKLVRGGFRVGVATGLLSRAVAEVAGIERELVQHRLAASFEPTAEGWHRLIAPSDGTRVGPYPFYLAHQLDREPPALGPIDAWLAEWKWDGIRSQLVKRGSETSLWSRSGEPIGHQFPEVVAAARGVPEGTVLDGEILIVDGDRPLPFADLQKRLNRKVAPAPQMGLFETKRVVFKAFDALEAGGDDLRSRPLAERRAAIEWLLTGLQDAVIRSSETVEAASWDELAMLRESSRSRGVEGLMLKHAKGVYGVGRTKPEDAQTGWWKWKVDPYTADLVLTTAYPGTGRRASLYTDYGFSTIDAAGGLVQVTRAYSGLTNDEIERLDAWIRRHTVERHGPLRAVEPTRVFEIGFEGIARSDRHKAGLAFRFPRILRERNDKAPSQATGLSELEALVRSGEPR